MRLVWWLPMQAEQLIYRKKLQLNHYFTPIPIEPIVESLDQKLPLFSGTWANASDPSLGTNYPSANWSKRLQLQFKVLDTVHIYSTVHLAFYPAV